MRLMSFVWPDQIERVRRLHAAFEVAARVPAVVEQADAADFLHRELADLPRGAVTVVWHSVVWQYLDKPERERVLSLLDDAGARATEQSPLAHVAFEPLQFTPDHRFAFLASMTVWPGGKEALIAEGQGHGPPVVWQ